MPNSKHLITIFGLACGLALMPLSLRTARAQTPKATPTAQATTQAQKDPCSIDTGLVPNPNCRGELPTQRRLTNSEGCNNNNPLCGSWFTSINSLWRRMVNIVILLIDAIALVNLLLASLGYITSAGNPDAAKKAKQRIINSVIAIALISSIYVIINLIVTIGSGFAP